MRMVQTAAIPRSNTKVTSIIYTKDIFTVPIRIMSMSMRWRRVARIHPLALRHMDVARTMVSTLMVPVADTRRCRMAVTPTISSKATCIMRIRGTATTTAPSRWLDEISTRSDYLSRFAAGDGVSSRERGESSRSPKDLEQNWRPRHFAISTGCRGHPCPRKRETHGGFHIKSSDLPFP